MSTTTKPEGLLADEAPIWELDELRQLDRRGTGTRVPDDRAGRRPASRRSTSPRSRCASCTPTSRSRASTCSQDNGGIAAPAPPITEGPPGATDARRRRAARPSASKPEIDLTVEPSLDSLRLYLRSIGRVVAADRRAGGRAREAHRARRHAGQAADGRGQPAARRLDRQGLPRPRADVPRPDPGGLARPDPRGREVRLPPRLQVLDVRDLVDPPGGDPRDRRQGPHDPHPRPHGREAQQGRARRAPARAAARPRARAGGDRRRARAARRARCATSCA